VIDRGAAGAAPSALRILVGDRTLHVPLGAVEAVVRAPRLTTVPGTPASLAGLFNHQGTVCPAVHPLADRVAADRHAVVVRSRQHGRFALLCDWAEDLAAPPPGEPPLDLDALASRVIAAYPAPTAAPAWPRPDRPTALIRLRRPGGQAVPPAS
jgi:hypothetical protein